MSRRLTVFLTRSHDSLPEIKDRRIQRKPFDIHVYNIFILITRKSIISFDTCFYTRFHQSRKWVHRWVLDRRKRDNFPYVRICYYTVPNVIIVFRLCNEKFLLIIIIINHRNSNNCPEGILG